MNRLGLVSVAEPFAGLFTQGMVCHETYRSGAGANGAWVSPDEVEKRGGKAFLKGTDTEVEIGPSEKMSKSKKNVIAPEAIIADYGADTIRWFMLSDTPPERDIEWTDAGAEGCWRFVQRVWRLAAEAEDLPAPGTAPVASDEISKTLRQASHKAIAAVTDHLAGLRFNSAVAQLYMLANAIADATKAYGAVRREALETLVLLSAPMMPHLAETCWQALGHEKLVVETSWPKHDPALLESNNVTIAVQVNGKRRGEVIVPRDADNQSVEIAALALDGVVRALEGKAPKKVIVVPGRIVNIVAWILLPSPFAGPRASYGPLPLNALCAEGEAGLCFGRASLFFCCLALAGCGFHPLYGDAHLSPRMASRFMSSRSQTPPAMSLRNSLIDLLGSNGETTGKAYRLTLTVVDSSQGVALQNDATITRYNDTLTVSYVLADNQGKELTHGSMTGLSSYNVATAPYATQSARRDADTRALQDIAQRLRLDLGVYFSRHQ